MSYSDEQVGAAYRAVSTEQREAEQTLRRLNLIMDCISHISRGERPFRHDYTETSHHNGDFYRTSDIVWAKVKPTPREDESYILLDMPEYEEALRRLEAVPKVTPNG